MTTRIVTLAERPDLLPIVARWQWDEWGRPRGRRLESVTHELAPLAARGGAEAGFVRLAGETPVGTACLTLTDLDSRPDLSPWLASVFVPPEHRGQGHAGALVRAVESAAAARGHTTLWLFTWTTAALYAGLGWQTVGPAEHASGPVTLMRRDLSPGVPPPVAAGR